MWSFLLPVHLRLPLSVALALPCAVFATGGCGASEAESTSGAGASESPAGSDAAQSPAPPSGGANGDFAGSSDAGRSGAAAPPPEVEVEGVYDTPAATGTVIWSANAVSGRVTAIGAATLERVSVSAGNGPGNMVAIPGAGDTVAVLNDLSNDATILRYLNGRITTETVKTAETANAWAVSRTGVFAIAWTDAAKRPGAVLTQGFQELDVVSVASPARGTRLAVGYRPFSVLFNSVGTRAVVASRDGLTMIECVAGIVPRVIRHVPITRIDPSGIAVPYEFTLTPDGLFAVLRVSGAASFDIVNLTDSSKRTVTVGGVISDLDLSADGTTVYAVVGRPTVAASSPDAGADAAVDGAIDAGTLRVSAFYTFPVSAPDGTLATRTDLPLADMASTSVSADGTMAVFYTNGIDMGRVVIMSLQAPTTFRVVDTYAPVLAVFPTPNGEYALALHKPTRALTVSDPIGAFSLVPLKTELPSRIVATPGKVSAVATSPTSDRFVVLERSDERSAFAMHVAEVPALTARRYELASPPTSVGLVPSVQRAFASQVHPQGRMSLVDFGTGLLHTLTGFELGAR